MSESIRFKIKEATEEKIIEANLLLDNHPLTAELRAKDLNGLYVIGQADIDWSNSDECPDQEFFVEHFTNRQGMCDTQLLSGLDEEDMEKYSQILQALNEKFEIEYYGSIFNTQCYEFTKEQMQAITHFGERLIYNPLFEPEKEDIEWLEALKNFLSGKTWEELNGIDENSSETKETALSVHVEFLNNKNFYPTPKSLIRKMVLKLKHINKKRFLEPSAGTGTIFDLLNEEHSCHVDNLYAIEIDPTLQATLRGKGYKLIDSDFLSYNGLEQFDVILMNPPFDNGEKHLHKALDIMFSGEIVCILNANTIRNPFSNERKRLVQRLKELNASIEYIEAAFSNEDSQRKTDVEVALIHIKIVQDVEQTLFADMKSEDEIQVDDFSKEQNEVATLNKISNLVIEFNRERQIITDQIMSFYKNYKLTKKYLSIQVGDEGDGNYERQMDTTSQLKTKLTKFNRMIKWDYWRKAMDLKEVKARLTSASRRAVEADLQKFCEMEFNEANVRQFIINIINRFPEMINGAILSMFDKMTKHALRDPKWGESEFAENIHYYSAWKSNNGYKVNKKVIIPCYGQVVQPYDKNKYRIEHRLMEELDDFERCMSYFDGKIESPTTGALLQRAVEFDGKTKKIDTPYFLITVYKKETVHIEFKDEDLLRRFNIEVGRQKSWLPMDYSEKPWESMDKEEQSTVTAFEGKGAYRQILNGIIQIPMKPLQVALGYCEQKEEIKEEVSEIIEETPLMDKSIVTCLSIESSSKHVSQTLFDFEVA